MSNRHFQSVRDALSRIIPTPLRAFLRENDRLKALTETRLSKDKFESRMSQMMGEIRQLRDETQQLRAENAEQLMQLSRQLNLQREDTLSAVQAVLEQGKESARYASEAVWAEIFNNTIAESAWLKNKTFSPGRWAVDYPALYVMYRILNETKPQKLLEIGLGQSTRMIGQYAAAFPQARHTLVEHDASWIDFFQRDFPLSANTKVLRLDLEMKPFRHAAAVRSFHGFDAALAGKRFDFIFVDAPLGSDMREFARVDVLFLLPACLESNFVIMIHDAERAGETATVNAVQSCLREHGIAYVFGRYRGMKDTVVLCSESRRFVASM